MKVKLKCETEIKANKDFVEIRIVKTTEGQNRRINAEEFNFSTPRVGMEKWIIKGGRNKKKETRPAEMEKEIIRKRLEIVEKRESSRKKIFEKKDKINRLPMGNEKKLERLTRGEMN